MLHTTRTESRTTPVGGGARRSSRLFSALLATVGVIGAVGVDAQARPPAVASVTVPPAGRYDATLALHFTARFDAPVVVTGTPRLALRVGETIRYATAVRPLGATPASPSLTFEYIPAARDQDDDGIEVMPIIDLHHGLIQGTDTTPAQLEFWAPDTRELRVAAHRPPTPRIMGLASVSDEATRAEAFVLRGTADGGSQVTITLVEVGPVGTTTAAPNGAWAFRYPAALLSPGIHRLTATIVNSSGEVSAESAPVDIRVGPNGSPMR